MKYVIAKGSRVLRDFSDLSDESSVELFYTYLYLQLNRTREIPKVMTDGVVKLAGFLLSQTETKNIMRPTRKQ